MTSLRDTIDTAARFLSGRTDFRPEFGIILGTGLGGFAEEIESEFSIPFDEVPGFVATSCWASSAVAR
jgi:purine-nucleoside phosphorylase